MTVFTQILPYQSSFKEQCLSLFIQNTPPFFALSEQRDYEQFLENVPETYCVIATGQNKLIVGAFGLQRICSEKQNEGELR